ncbi:MAG: hypothetical protein DRI69_10815 [Bacteroidetes bacterium]|nr:MAG: hypothetical protein DRI69_10815 [Bacteroidota bacterium]
MGKLAFSGLSLLFPTVIMALYVKPFPKLVCIISILVSEVLLIALYNGWISDSWLLGFDAAIVLLGIQGLAMGFILIMRRRD